MPYMLCWDEINPFRDGLHVWVEGATLQCWLIKNCPHWWHFLMTLFYLSSDIMPLPDIGPFYVLLFLLSVLCRCICYGRKLVVSQPTRSMLCRLVCHYGILVVSYAHISAFDLSYIDLYCIVVHKYWLMWYRPRPPLPCRISAYRPII